MPGTQLSRRLFERILVIKPSSLGDVVHALPVLHGLRMRFPKAKIDWLIGSPFAPLLEGHDQLDELILFDRRRLGRMRRSPRAAAEFIRFVRTLREKRYDLAVDLQGLFRTGFLTRACGAGVRIGFRDAREGAWLFYTHHLPPAAPDTHAVDRNYEVADLLGFDDVPIEFNLALPTSARSEALALLRSFGLARDDRLVVVVPGARWETKVWLFQRFAETIDNLQEDGTGRCLLVGGPDEVDLCARIADACRSQPINLAGRTTVRELAAVVALADVVLCQDSAAMHLAVALKRPLVCLIGPTNPARTGPYRREGDALCADVDCAPCYLRRLSQCRHGHRCMKELDTARVVAAVRRAIAQPALARP